MQNLTEAAGRRHPAPVPIKHYGQWAGAAIVVVVAAALVMVLAQNKNIDYAIVLQNLTASTVLYGLWLTFGLTLIGMAIGVVFGLIVALGRMSQNVVLSALANGFIWLFRGVPLLVQILIWGNFSLLFPTLGLGVPFTGFMFFQVDTNSVMTTFVASCLGLGLHEAAYMAEIYRGGILAVNGGQREAATALGMNSWRAMREVVLPQAIRVIIPPAGNQFISLLKASSLVSVIAGGDLLSAVQNIAAVNYRTMELLFVATFWYLVIVSILSVGQHYIERRLSRGRT